MYEDRALMRIHVATLFTLDDAGRLVRVNEPNGGDAPRVFVGRTGDGVECWLRWDVDDGLAQELTALCATVAGSAVEPREDAARFEALLARTAPFRRTWAGPAFWVPDDLPAFADAVCITEENAHLLRAHLPEWLDSISPAHQAHAVIVDGSAVAVCSSARIGRLAHEAGVETAPAFRGQGYAAHAVAAWAAAVRRTGRIPLYSTSWDNTASQAVARKLGFRMFGTDLHIT